ncbi:hypothetical protein CISG_02071 [Coccidioides immitis RMSCC 3703]|uniref:Uncharacterized protein n=1 Tax=Coccidioides immitis RMSCC 3703 TaxID=454286 RepID=A0A0J8R7D8_COCIT|nr:hypothetical protein CISG_02071 [Coccidioides immitis RMSCC 3703]
MNTKIAAAILAFTTLTVNINAGKNQPQPSLASAVLDIVTDSVSDIDANKVNVRDNGDLAATDVVTVTVTDCSPASVTSPVISTTATSIPVSSPIIETSSVFSSVVTSVPTISESTTPYVTSSSTEVKVSSSTETEETESTSTVPASTTAPAPSNDATHVTGVTGVSSALDRQVSKELGCSVELDEIV